MKTYIRRQQHKNIKHQDTKQKEPPQKYRLGTISNKKLLAGSLSWPSLTQTENLTGKSFKWAFTTDTSSVSVSR